MITVNAMMVWNLVCPLVMNAKCFIFRDLHKNVFSSQLFKNPFITLYDILAAFYLIF